MGTPNATRQLVQRANSRILERNLVRATGIPKPGNAATHHIVAGNDWRADDARRILNRFGIDLNSAANGVFLPANASSPNLAGAAVHSTLHTNAYYIEVTERLRLATSQEHALSILQEVADQLLTGGLK